MQWRESHDSFESFRNNDPHLLTRRISTFFRIKIKYSNNVYISDIICGNKAETIVILHSCARIEHLLLHGLRDPEIWDLDALPLIAGWKNLRSLHLKHIPITDGQFLIEIGKQCQYLEKVSLQRLGPGESCCYLDELFIMLPNCRNLKDFTIDQGGLGDVSEMFRSLANNREIESVTVSTKERDNRSRNLKLASPVEQLLHDCPKLTQFCFNDRAMSPWDMGKIRSAMLRYDIQYLPSIKICPFCELHQLHVNFVRTSHVLKR